MNRETFDCEIAMCRKLYKKSQGCNWGKCVNCGAVPLLYKLYKGELVENNNEVQRLKDKILK